MVTYSYEKIVRADQLQKEIEGSSISVAVSYIDTIDTTVNINFMDEISIEEKSTLDSLVDAHVPVVVDPPPPSKVEKINQIVSTMNSSYENGQRVGGIILNVLLPAFEESKLDEIIAIMESL